MQPEQVKARLSPLYAALLGGGDFELPQLPEGFPKFDLFHRDEDEELAIGLKLKREGLKPAYPFIIVPGFVTSGLELWHGERCARKFFRYASIWLFLRTSSIHC